jgi:transcriptional regulator with XRE-family HTH domain
MPRKCLKRVQSDLKTIHRRIAKLRKEAGMSQHDMADALSMAYRTYSEKERSANNKDFYLHEILAIAEVLDISSSAIMSGNNASKAHEAIKNILQAHYAIEGDIQSLRETSAMYDRI